MTLLRKRLRERAHRAAKEDMEPELDMGREYLEKLVSRMHKGYF